LSPRPPAGGGECASLPPVTIVLDPGVAAWLLRRELRRVAEALGTPPLGPAVPIAGPVRLREDAGLAAVRHALSQVVPRVPYLSYEIDGFGARPRGAGGTVGIRVRPSPLLASASRAIGAALEALAVPGDPPDEEVLIPAARLPDSRQYRSARRILGIAGLPWYRRLVTLFSPEEPGGTVPAPGRLLDALRLLILVGDRPVAGFDLVSRRWIARPLLADRGLRAASLRAYRHARGLELDSHPPGDRTPGETWFLADLHLGHPGIALHCARPFLAADVAEMDRVLVENWRRTVGPNDRAYLVGDLCAPPDPSSFLAAAGRLTGRLAIVRGNHDPDLPGLARSIAFTAGGHRFLAVHDPTDAPPGFDGWVIHGHLHDSDLRRHPFFDPVARRVNVSAETAGYRPVPLSLVERLIREGADPVPLRAGMDQGYGGTPGRKG